MLWQFNLIGGMNMGNFKVRCVKLSKNSNFELNKVYEVKNGTIVSDTGWKFNGWSNGVNATYKEFSKWWNEDKHCSHFELVEEKPSFKVRCTEFERSCSYTTGKEYEICGGYLINDVGDKHSFEGVNEWNRVQWDQAICKVAKFELVEEKMFSKSDLKTGMRVETREGDLYVVYLGTESGDIIQGTWWGFLNRYGSDLTVHRETRLDIVKVYSKDMNNNLSDVKKLGILLYERIKPLTMTVSEAQAELSKIKGKEVLIVKE